MQNFFKINFFKNYFQTVLTQIRTDKIKLEQFDTLDLKVFLKKKKKKKKKKNKKKCFFFF